MSPNALGQILNCLKTLFTPIQVVGKLALQCGPRRLSASVAGPPFPPHPVERVDADQREYPSRFMNEHSKWRGPSFCKMRLNHRHPEQDLISMSWVVLKFHCTRSTISTMYHGTEGESSTDTEAMACFRFGIKLMLTVEVDDGWRTGNYQARRSGSSRTRSADGPPCSRRTTETPEQNREREVNLRSFSFCWSFGSFARKELSELNQRILFFTNLASCSTRSRSASSSFSILSMRL
jgi:hypothetical protein